LHLSNKIQGKESGDTHHKVMSHGSICLSVVEFILGEYISLYHHQRALLQQRESQKNEYISHLARDREEIQVFLGVMITH
jgi:hypothetical protein